VEENTANNLKTLSSATAITLAFLCGASGMKKKKSKAPKLASALRVH